MRIGCDSLPRPNEPWLRLGGGCRIAGVRFADRHPRGLSVTPVEIAELRDFIAGELQKVHGGLAEVRGDVGEPLPAPDREPR